MVSLLDITVTYLEMRRPPARPKASPPSGKTAVVRADPPTTAFYRFLYNNVGEKWLWWMRREMADAPLKAILTDPRLYVNVLYVNGCPAGYCEMDTRILGEVEIAYFGLMEPFIGRGLGRYLLDWTVDTAWTHKPDRIWLHTCTLDHPRALPVYQKAGFTPYKQTQEQIEDPRDKGLITFKSGG